MASPPTVHDDGRLGNIAAAAETTRATRTAAQQDQHQDQLQQRHRQHRLEHYTWSVPGHAQRTQHPIFVQFASAIAQALRPPEPHVEEKQHGIEVIAAIYTLWGRELISSDEAVEALATGTELEVVIVEWPAG